MQVPRLVSYITHSFRVAAFTQTLPGELGCSSQNDENLSLHISLADLIHVGDHDTDEKIQVILYL